MKSGPTSRLTHGPSAALLGLFSAILAAVAVVFCVGFAGTLVEIAGGSVDAEEVQLSELGVAFATVCAQVAILMVIWKQCQKTIGSMGFLLGLRRSRPWWWLVVFVVPAGSLSELFYTWAQGLFAGWETGSVETIRESLHGGGLAGILSLVSILVLAPVVEELMFRGWLYSGLVDRLRPVFTILITTLAFVAFHMDLHQSVAIIPLGLFLGWLRAVTGSIWPCILAHWINNLVASLGLMEVDLWGVLPIEVLYAGLIPLAVMVWKLRSELNDPRVLLEQRRWSSEVHARLQALLDGPPGLVCFDWDNTCIEGDIGDALLLAVDGPERALWTAYEQKIAEGEVAEAYGEAACVLAGRTPEEAHAFCEGVFSAGVGDGSIKPVAEMADLVAVLMKAGWEVWVVSASAEPMVRVAAATYHVPVERVIGIRCVEKNGRILAEIDGPVLYGPGKVKAIIKRIGRLPDLALGDAPTDREMMLTAANAVLIGTQRPEMVALAGEQGWGVQPRFSEQSS